MIFPDTNVISETMRLRPDQRVIDWLIRHDAELALSGEADRCPRRTE